jgi:hypothetical protein
MKKPFQKLAMLLSAIVLIAMVFTLNSCKKSEDTTTPSVIVLDGYYVMGAGTAYTTYNEKAMMKATRNEVTQTTLPSLMELYIPVKATGGFNIAKVAGSVIKVYGPGTGFGTVTQLTVDDPKFPFQRGPAAVSTTPFTVPTDGMYHIVFDDSLNVVAVMPVHWGLIGAATPGGWTTDTMMTESAFNSTTMSWTLTGLLLQKGDWKYRYSKGWKVEIDTTNADKTKWVKVNTNLGGAVDALVPGGGNITNADAGLYTATMTYTLGSGYTATLTKTGNVPPKDYSTYQMGIIGNCYLKSDGITQANWDENFGTQLPVVTGGTNYDWTYTIDINVAGQFKFRQGTDWSGKSIGFADVTMAGPAAANFTDSGSDHNFAVSVTGNYTIVLHIDAVTEIYTVTATKN